MGQAQQRSEPKMGELTAATPEIEQGNQSDE